MALASAPLSADESLTERARPFPSVNEVFSQFSRTKGITTSLYWQKMSWEGYSTIIYNDLLLIQISRK